LGACPRVVQEVVGLALGLGQELLALLEQPAGPLQLLGQALDRLVEQLEHLVLVLEANGRRERDRLRVADDVGHAPQQDLGVELLHREALVGLAHRANLSFRRWATTGGTIEETSPPKRATSRTRLDERN